MTAARSAVHLSHPEFTCKEEEEGGGWGVRGAEEGKAEGTEIGEWGESVSGESIG